MAHNEIISSRFQLIALFVIFAVLSFVLMGSVEYKVDHSLSRGNEKKIEKRVYQPEKVKEGQLYYANEKEYYNLVNKDWKVERNWDNRWFGRSTTNICFAPSDYGWAFLTNVYENIQKSRNTPKCKNNERFGEAGDGGKVICTDNDISHTNDEDCIVYSLGSRGQFDFELDILSKTKCKVFTFDCTSGSLNTWGTNEIPKGINFYPWCLGDSNEVKNIFGIDGQFYTLPRIMEKLGHHSINLLKMDIEGSEFEVILADSFDLSVAPKQISLEVHISYTSIDGWKARNGEEYNRFWKKLDSMNYKAFSYEPNPLCICCCEFSVIRY